MIKAEFQKKLASHNGEMKLDVSLQLQRGSFVSLYGKSGSGKTTILRVLAGLTNPEKGLITYENETWFDTSKKINLQPQKRKIGFVFQDHALIPNMTVRENLDFFAGKNNINKVNEMLNLINLEGLAACYPSTLSGGQKQRVAIARALIVSPEILFLDEPFSSLDQETKEGLQIEIIRLHYHFGLTSVLVSHDVNDLTKMSDRVLHLHEGKIVKDGTAEEILNQKKIKGSFQITGEIMNITSTVQGDYELKVLVANELITVSTPKEVAEFLKVGEKILVSNAFEPVVMKI